MGTTLRPNKPQDLDEHIFCLESQEWTYGIDNTGTRYNDVATYEISLSDGTTLSFSQDGSSTNWTPQLIEWANNIQQAADDAGLQWFVEPRFIDDYNVTNLDGTINGPGGTPSGLPGAPSELVAVSLHDGGMRWRYVNIQICPGQPVPVGARRLTSNLYTNNPYELTTAGPVLGPVQEFKVCESCDKDGSINQHWLIRDDGAKPAGFVGVYYRDANAGEIPNCYFPCGFLSLQPSPPGRECTFFIETECDNLNQTDQSMFETEITRRTVYCPGQPPTIDYLHPDPADPTALVEYTLVGEFVDCDTGEVIEPPKPPCEDTEFNGFLWRLQGDLTPGAVVDWWAPTTFPGGSNAAPHGDVDNIFTSNGRTLEHVNGAPDVTYISPTFAVSGTSSAAFMAAVGAASNAETNGTDQLKFSGYVVNNQPALLRDNNGNTGERGALYINRCCAGSLEKIAERETDTSGASGVGVFENVVLPVGIHYIEAATSDLSAWQGLNLQVSYDDGVTWTDFTTYLTKPRYTCIPTQRCEDTGLIIDSVTGALITVGAFDQWHRPPDCVEAETAAVVSGPAPTVHGRHQRLTGTQNIGFIGGAGLGGNVRSITVNVIRGTAIITDGETNSVTYPRGSYTWSATGDNEPTNGLLRAVAAGGAASEVIVHWTEII